MAKISKPQTRTLRSLAAQYLPGGDDGYRSFLYESFPGKDWKKPNRPSTLELTTGQANKAIRALLRLKRAEAKQSSGDSAPGRPIPAPAYGRPWKSRYEAIGSLSQKQADEIARLEWKLDWHEQPERLRGFIERQTGEEKAPGALAKNEATSCITALRKMAA